MKKGRHRRYEEARELKRSYDDPSGMFDHNDEPCDECGALPGEKGKSWCEQCRTRVAEGDSESLFPS